METEKIIKNLHKNCLFCIDTHPLNNLKKRAQSRAEERLVFLREINPLLLLLQWLLFPAEVANILIKPEEDSLSPP